MQHLECLTVATWFHLLTGLLCTGFNMTLACNDAIPLQVYTQVQTTLLCLYNIHSHVVTLLGLCRCHCP